jgi:hypothetical protein
MTKPMRINSGNCVVRNPCLEIALAELEAAGVRGVERAYGGKHPQLRWRVNGGALRIYAIPGTPSDLRSPLNVRADIRRLLRADGVAVGSEKTEPPPPSRKPDRITELEQRVAALEQAIAKLKSN